MLDDDFATGSIVGTDGSIARGHIEAAFGGDGAGALGQAVVGLPKHLAVGGVDGHAGGIFAGCIDDAVGSTGTGSHLTAHALHTPELLPIGGLIGGDGRVAHDDDGLLARSLRKDGRTPGYLVGAATAPQFPSGGDAESHEPCTHIVVILYDQLAAIQQQRRCIAIVVIRDAEVFPPKPLPVHIGTNDVACGKDGTDLFAVGRYGGSCQPCISRDIGHLARRPADARSTERPAQLTRPKVKAIELAPFGIGAGDEDVAPVDDG